MMTKNELQELARSYQEKSDTAYWKYQYGGDKRSYNVYYKNANLAEALRMAANAEADHEYMLTLKSYISSWASDAKSGKDISKSVIEFAESHDLIKTDNWEAAK